MDPSFLFDDLLLHCVLGGEYRLPRAVNGFAVRYTAPYGAVRCRAVLTHPRRSVVAGFSAYSSYILYILTLFSYFRMVFAGFSSDFRFCAFLMLAGALESSCYGLQWDIFKNEFGQKNPSRCRIPYGNRTAPYPVLEKPYGIDTLKCR